MKIAKDRNTIIDHFTEGYFLKILVVNKIIRDLEVLVWILQIFQDEYQECYSLQQD